MIGSNCILQKQALLTLWCFFPVYCFLHLHFIQMIRSDASPCYMQRCPVTGVFHSPHPESRRRDGPYCPKRVWEVNPINTLGPTETWGVSSRWWTLARGGGRQWALRCFRFLFCGVICEAAGVVNNTLVLLHPHPCWPPPLSGSHSVVCSFMYLLRPPP